jgi:YgiT-type zinc finger domain-containing protein
MTCFFCRGEMLPSTTTHMIELDPCILIVKNVPCRRCSQCGEVTLASDVIEQLDRLAGLYADAAAEVAVVDYPLQTA